MVLLLSSKWRKKRKYQRHRRAKMTMSRMTEKILREQTRKKPTDLIVFLYIIE